MLLCNVWWWIRILYLHNHESHCIHSNIKTKTSQKGEKPLTCILSPNDLINNFAVWQHDHHIRLKHLKILNLYETLLRLDKLYYYKSTKMLTSRSILYLPRLHSGLVKCFWCISNQWKMFSALMNCDQVFINFPGI